MIIRKIQDDTLSFYDGEQPVLIIQETDIPDGVLMSLKGALRSDLTHHIQDELDAFITVGIHVTLDFQEVSYVSASVLLALIDSQQLVDYLRKGKILLKNIPAEVYQEMNRSGASEELLIER